MTIPPELLRSRPRSVELTQSGAAKLAFSSIVGVAVIVSHGLGAANHQQEIVSYIVTGLPFGAVFAIARLRRQVRLLANGRPTIARIIADETRWKPRIYTRRLRCDYQTISGATRTTLVTTTSRTLAVGNETILLYDPDEPEKAILYPAELFTIKRR